MKAPWATESKQKTPAELKQELQVRVPPHLQTPAPIARAAADGGVVAGEASASQGDEARRGGAGVAGEGGAVSADSTDPAAFTRPGHRAVGRTSRYRGTSLIRNNPHAISL